MSQNPHDYSYVLATVGLSGLQEAAFDLSKVLDADGTPAQASRVRRAFLSLLADLERIAVEIAQQAEENVVKARQQGQVRPDTGGAGGPRLDAFIGKSSPLIAVEGSVGINNEPFLDSSPAYWWRAIDMGYDWSGHQDSDIKGVFMPGNARPDAGQFQAHPLFRAMGKGPRMTPANDIEPQEFVRRGFEKTEADWHRLVQQAKAKFMREVNAALAAAGPPKGLASHKGRKPGPRRS